MLLQALVIGLGWVGTLRLAASGIAERAQDRLLEENSRTVDQFAQMLEQRVKGPVVEGTPAWEEAQDLVETFEPPQGASLYVLDPGGSVLCHKAMRESPSLRRVDFAGYEVRLHGVEERVSFAEVLRLREVSGRAEFAGGSALFASRGVPSRGVRVLVMQSDAGLAAATRQLTQGISLWCGIAGLIVLAVTATGTAALVWQYDSILARANTALEGEVERRTRRGLDIRNGLIFGLAKLADYRDTDTGKHLERICRYCEILGESLLGTFDEIDRPWIHRLALASSMHDIGKVGIPDSILLKPGRFTPEEREIMEQHPLIGADTLIAIRRRVGDDDLLNMGIQVTLSHHERYDGTGYPYKLSRDQIPLPARLVALADVYDALTSSRVYKSAMPHEEAVRIIKEGSGTQFDPVVVEAFLRVERQFDSVRAQLQPAEGTVDTPYLAAHVAWAQRVQKAAA